MTYLDAGLVALLDADSPPEEGLARLATQVAAAVAHSQELDDSDRSLLEAVQQRLDGRDALLRWLWEVPGLAHEVAVLGVCSDFLANVAADRTLMSAVVPGAGGGLSVHELSALAADVWWAVQTNDLRGARALCMSALPSLAAWLGSSDQKGSRTAAASEGLVHELRLLDELGA